jgi:hypothetical protein
MIAGLIDPARPCAATRLHCWSAIDPLAKIVS